MMINKIILTINGTQFNEPTNQYSIGKIPKAVKPTNNKTLL